MASFKYSKLKLQFWKSTESGKKLDYREDGGSVFFQNFDTYLHIHLYIRPFNHPSFDLSIYLHIYISFSNYLATYTYIYPPIYLPIYLPNQTRIHPLPDAPIHLSIHLTTYQ
jgi:hypothetical protein